MTTGDDDVRRGDGAAPAGAGTAGLGESVVAEGVDAAAGPWTTCDEAAPWPADAAPSAPEPVGAAA